MVTYEILHIGPRRFTSPTGRLYIDADLIDAADNWFSVNKVFMMNTKSKVWAKICRKVSRDINTWIKEELKSDAAYYSRKAGCTCGCSPGWVVKGGTIKRALEDGKIEDYVLTTCHLSLKLTFGESYVEEFVKWMGTLQEAYNKEFEKDQVNEEAVAV